MILWDIVGSCNLRCPSCPMGTMREAARTNGRGLITEDLFRAVLQKIHREFSCRQLHLYNWTEPLLHHRVAAFSHMASCLGFHVHLSTNLNLLPNPDGLLSSGIKTLRISLSGFSQAVYERGHRGGNIEKVKANMRRLAIVKRAVGGDTRIHVYFHRYRHNVQEEEKVAALARELGFEFLADWAFLMPLERLAAAAHGALPEAEQEFFDQSILPSPRNALALVREKVDPDASCELMDQLVLDHMGRARLCCATFDGASNVLGNFLEISWRDLQARRRAHAVCRGCMSLGAHRYFTAVSDPPLRAALAEMATQSLAFVPTSRSTCINLPILRDHPDLVARSA